MSWSYLYSGENINKFLWMVRIKGEYPQDIKVRGIFQDSSYDYMRLLCTACNPEVWF